MKIIKTSEINEVQEFEIFELWNNESPLKLRHIDISDFKIYLNNLINLSHFLLIDEKGKLFAWGMNCLKDKDIWFAVIVNSKIHSKGLGTQLLNEMKQHNDKLSGWVIDHNNDRKLNGEIYPTPIDFYLKNNFKILPHLRLENEKLSAVKIEWVKA